MKDFYRLGYTDKSAGMLIDPVVEYDTEKLIGANTLLAARPCFVQKKKQAEMDVICFADGKNIVISERLKKLLEEYCFTGWSCFEANIEGMDTPYYVFQSLGEVGPVLNAAAWEKGETTRMEFDINTWGGWDFFHFRDVAVHVCSQRVKDMIESHGIGNITFARI